jgi:anti-sigma B factor antagonist
MTAVQGIAWEFGVEHRTEDGLDVVAVRGDVDIFTARALRRVLEDVIWRSGRGVAVDLTGAASIDTHGLALLLNAARRLEGRGRSFTVVCAEPTVRRAFEVTKVERQLHLVDALDDAGQPAEPERR